MKSFSHDPFGFDSEKVGRYIFKGCFKLARYSVVS